MSILKLNNNYWKSKSLDKNGNQFKQNKLINIFYIHHHSCFVLFDEFHKKKETHLRKIILLKVFFHLSSFCFSLMKKKNEIILYNLDHHHPNELNSRYCKI